MSDTIRLWRLLNDFAGTHIHGIDEETVPVFCDWLRERSLDDLADRIEAGELREELIDKSIPSIEELDEKDFPGRKKLGMNRFGYVMPLLFGAGRLCVGPMNCTFGFDHCYDYEEEGLAFEALASWDGIGLPPEEGMTRRSGLNGKWIRTATPSSR